jgi:aminopeptidase N
VKATFELTINLPKKYNAISNTEPASDTIDGSTKTIKFRTTPKMPTYLLAWAVGEFDVDTATAPKYVLDKITFNVL